MVKVGHKFSFTDKAVMKRTGEVLSGITGIVIRVYTTGFEVKYLKPNEEIASTHHFTFDDVSYRGPCYDWFDWEEPN